MHALWLSFQPEYAYWIMFLIVGFAVSVEGIRGPDRELRNHDDQVAWGQRKQGR